ncbi:MAG: hypothetical protein II991_00800 [Bacteroidales bacterium]|nr:hypothetical protein [Bacteroidales bacterium]
MSRIENVEVFNARGSANNAALVLGNVVCSVLEQILHIYPGVEYRYVYSCTGLSTTFYLINDHDSTLSVSDRV